MSWKTLGGRRRWRRESRKLFRMLTIIVLIATICLIAFGQRTFEEKISIRSSNILEAQQVHN